MTEVAHRSGRSIDTATPNAAAGNAPTDTSAGLETFRGRYAGVASRGAAVCVDAVTIIVMFYAGVGLAILTLALVKLEKPQVLSLPDLGWALGFGFWLFLYAWGSWSLTGKTVGKALLGLRIVTKRGEPIGAVRALRRCFGWVVSLMFFGLGFLWILISRDRRGWHDYIAGTCVIYDWDARTGNLLKERRQKAEAALPAPHH